MLPAASSIRVSIDVAGREIEEPWSFRVPMDDAGLDIADVGRMLPAPTVDENPPAPGRVEVGPGRDMVDEA